MNNPPRAVRLILCALATDPPTPGSWRGYHCRQCGREVEVSPTGRLQIDRYGSAMLIVCNPCGLAAAEFAKAIGKPIEVGINPAAQRSLAEMGIEVRPQAPECDVCGAKPERMWDWKTREFMTVGKILMGRHVGNPACKWRLCGECSALWRARDARALSVRFEIMQKATPDDARAFEVLYSLAIEATESGPVQVEVL